MEKGPVLRAILCREQCGMINELTTEPAVSESLQAKYVYAMAAIFFLVGLAIGYLFPGSQFTAAPSQTVARATAPTAAAAMGNAHMPSMEEMKQMADKQAAPLLEKLKSDPNDLTLLTQVGAIYHITHQFGEAAAFYGRASQVAPTNDAVRTKLALSLYRSGDADGAIAQLNQALRYDPKDANSLFDLGMIRLQGKGDGRGAVAAWQQLLKTNPQLSPDRKATVVKLIADVMTTLDAQQGMGGVRHHDAR